MLQVEKRLILLLLFFYSIEFVTPALTEGRSISFEWQQVSFWILLGIWADLNNAVVWMVSTRLFIFMFSSSSTNIW